MNEFIKRLNNQAIGFIIPGHPVPYTRTTQRAKYMSKQWKRYAKYKTDVVTAFIESFEEHDQVRLEAIRNQIITKKRNPIVSNHQRVYMYLAVWFRDAHRGDPSNIVKGIEDALFLEDKYLTTSLDYDYDNLNPRVEVFITINRKEWIQTMIDNDPN